MTRYFYAYFALTFFSACQIAWGGKIPYDPDLESHFATSYSIVTVPQIKQSAEESKETKEDKYVKLSLSLNHPELYTQGDDGACAFFSTVCSMLLVESGKTHLNKMFLGQDDDFVYIKFPAPSPFGITDIDEFLERFEGNWHYGFDKAQYLKKNVFKVSKEIIEGHIPLSAFPNAPGWFRLLAAAYFKVIQSIDEDGDQRHTFEFLPTSFHVMYFQGELKNTEIDILSGKPLLFNLHLEEAYEKKELPPVSLLINKPIRNTSIGVHGRAMYISENDIRFFDSLKPEKGIFTSTLFNDRVERDKLEDEMTRNIFSLLTKVKSIHEKIMNWEEDIPLANENALLIKEIKEKAVVFV